MMNLIRNELMYEDDEPFSGAIEADETYVGGKRRGTGQRGRPGRDSHKTPVFGMVERSGRVSAVTIKNVRADTLLPHIEKRILPESIVYTDELSSYRRLGERGYEHRRIKHSAGVYVVGDVHTNTIEGFWALLKGGLRGVYHSVSAKHLQSYLSEYTWRYNRRNEPTAMFLSLLLRAARP